MEPARQDRLLPVSYWCYRVNPWFGEPGVAWVRESGVNNALSARSPHKCSWYARSQPQTGQVGSRAGSVRFTLHSHDSSWSSSWSSWCLDVSLPSRERGQQAVQRGDGDRPHICISLRYCNSTLTRIPLRRHFEYRVSSNLGRFFSVDACPCIEQILVFRVKKEFFERRHAACIYCAIEDQGRISPAGEGEGIHMFGYRWVRTLFAEDGSKRPIERLAALWVSCFTLHPSLLSSPGLTLFQRFLAGPFFPPLRPLLAAQVASPRVAQVRAAPIWQRASTIERARNHFHTSSQRGVLL